MAAWLGEQADARSFRVFFALFGLLLFGMPIRFWAYGWIDTLYLQPTFHFRWVWWAVVPPAPVLYGLFGLQTLCGAVLALSGLLGPRAPGRIRRLTWPAMLGYLLAFGYVELLDKTLYLNHYVLVTLLLGTLAVLPARPWAERVPRWTIALFRLELGLVWFWAGICKLDPDWLVRAWPLHTWLRARMEFPIVGPLLARWETALAMSWGGMLFDISVAFLLLIPRTRAFAFTLLAFFHVVTGVLFPIGVFPWVMVVGSTLFLPMDWPAQLARRIGWQVPDVPAVSGRLSSRQRVGLIVAAVVLVLFPARHLLLPGAVNWNERGFRFSWRVLLIEKTGLVDFRVEGRATGRSWTVLARDELTELQHKQMRTQPDMILDYAHHLAAREAEAGRRVAVYADSWASLNGRPTQRLIDPEVDLTTVTGWEWNASWIVPLQEEEPRGSE